MILVNFCDVRFVRKQTRKKKATVEVEMRNIKEVEESLSVGRGALWRHSRRISWVT